MPLTERELNAPGGMSTIDGGYMSGMNNIPSPVAAPTPTPTPVATPTPAATQPRATVAETFARGQQVLAGLPPLPGAEPELTIGQSFQAPTFEEGQGEFDGSRFDTALSEKELRDIERRQLKLFQGQIDATNQIYDQMLNEARMEGQGRLGSQRAMAARGGLLGSDFGASQKSKVQGFNTDVNRAIQAERSAKIGSIMGDVRSAVVAQQAEKRAAKQQGAEDYLNFLKNESTLKQNNRTLLAQSLLSQGIDPTTLDENELAALASEIGAKPQDVIMAYQQMASEQAAGAAEAGLSTRKTEAEIAKIEADIASGKLIKMGEGDMLYDPATGETFKNPKTFAPKSGSGADVTKQAGYTAAEQFIRDNPNATEEELRAGLLQYSDDYNLSVTDINAILSQAGAPKKADTREFTPSQITNIATKVRKAVADFSNNTEEELDKAKAYVQQGKIKTGGETISLTQSQIDDIVSELDDMGERNIFEIVLPGGG